MKGDLCGEGDRSKEAAENLKKHAPHPHEADDEAASVSRIDDLLTGDFMVSLLPAPSTGLESPLTVPLQPRAQAEP
jgi:hypothetical protein